MFLSTMSVLVSWACRAGPRNGPADPLRPATRAAALEQAPPGRTAPRPRESAARRRGHLQVGSPRGMEIRWTTAGTTASRDRRSTSGSTGSRPEGLPAECMGPPVVMNGCMLAASRYHDEHPWPAGPLDVQRRAPVSDVADAGPRGRSCRRARRWPGAPSPAAGRAAGPGGRRRTSRATRVRGAARAAAAP